MPTEDSRLARRVRAATYIVCDDSPEESRKPSFWWVCVPQVEERFFQAGNPLAVAEYHGVSFLVLTSRYSTTLFSNAAR